MTTVAAGGGAASPRWVGLGQLTRLAVVPRVVFPLRKQRQEISVAGCDRPDRSLVKLLRRVPPGSSFDSAAEDLCRLAVLGSERPKSLLAGVRPRFEALHGDLGEAEEGPHLPAALIKVIALSLIERVVAGEVELLYVELKPRLHGEAFTSWDCLQEADAHEELIKERAEVADLVSDGVKILCGWTRGKLCRILEPTQSSAPFGPFM